MPDQLFPLGRVMMTTNLQGRIQEANPEHWEDELKALIARHASGDWGNLEDFDRSLLRQTEAVPPHSDTRHSKDGKDFQEHPIYLHQRSATLDTHKNDLS